ncbi:DUF3906 family protein [Halalkalibacter krulwichiae]|uniref:DUF3906 domain-containing protein n=1 Tax=Halalkalibacter krulwichiae TaxID=199441 RepID=A0A1X9M9V4_9BACI|nr:DUF3906 family protein [Halalkalibacter krulwichiae]ARK29444.1 hypothetical protein BkAM31D_06015 [Halalkalibacter krulwichiae]
MNLYRFEVELEDTSVEVIVAASADEVAFDTAEKEVEKNYLKLPIISSITLLEKKPIKKAVGFVIE